MVQLWNTYSSDYVYFMSGKRTPNFLKRRKSPFLASCAVPYFVNSSPLVNILFEAVRTKLENLQICVLLPNVVSHQSASEFK